MSKFTLFTFINHRKYLFCTFLFLFLFAYSPISSAQNEGISLHGDFLSAVFSYGFDQQYPHPGNFQIGGQYNYPLSSIVELNGGIDLLWVELYGSLNGINKQVDIFMPLFLQVQRL